MSQFAVINDACVMSKGQVTIPENIRAALGISIGDRVTFIAENGTVRVISSAVYAMQRFQGQMQGQAEAAALSSEETVAELSRQEENNTGRNSKAFLSLMKMRRPIHGIDDKKELAEWREEKYGNARTDRYEYTD